MAVGGGGSVQGGYAASVMREMYGGSLPRAATQLLRDHAAASARRSTSAPPSTKVFSTSLNERPVQRRKGFERTAAVGCEGLVPKVGPGAAKALAESACAKPPRIPVSRRTLGQILQETSNYKCPEAVSTHGRDTAAEKKLLQDRSEFSIGGAHVLPGAAIPTASGAPVYLDRRVERRKRVSFSGSLPPSREGSPRNGTRPGMSSEMERMAGEIVQGVRERQRELDGVETSLVGLAQCAEAPTEATERRRVVRKEMASASQRRLELKSAINRDIKDLETLMDVSPDA